MREIVLDTETTGLDPAQGHRIVEIGAIELFHRMPTGKTYHTYLDPERDMPKEAEAVHGLGSLFLKGKPRFAEVAELFLEFLGDDNLVIHNAGFDMAFINAELAYLGKLALPMDRVTDTLGLARTTHPKGPNSLDALCRRYDIDNSRRTKHGALLDAELLADVYLEMMGGKQTSFGLADARPVNSVIRAFGTSISRARPAALPNRLTQGEIQAHEAAVGELGNNALWPH